MLFRSSGRLAFACWQEPRENPFFMAPLQAVYKHVPKLPQLGPEDPGPFSFASEARVKRILGEAGFSGIAMEPVKVELDVATGRGIDAAIQGALKIGPASRALEGHPEEVRAAAIASLTAARSPDNCGPADFSGSGALVVSTDLDGADLALADLRLSAPCLACRRLPEAFSRTALALVLVLVLVLVLAPCALLSPWPLLA